MNSLSLPRFRTFFVFVLLLALSTSFSRQCPADPDATGHVLWQLGGADGDDKEFALAPDKWSQYSDDAYYIVGQSTPGRDWSYVQPGPQDAWAGSRPHTSTIRFFLTQASPAGMCRLTLSLVDTQQHFPPHLVIRVNGRMYEFDTRAGGGDDSINGQPAHGKASEVAVDFPSSILTQGANTVEITTAAGSWLIYDALTLTGPMLDELGRMPGEAALLSARWLPDVLVRESGKLRQVLRVRFYNSGPSRNVDLTVSGEVTRSVDVPEGRGALDLTYPESSKEALTVVQVRGAAEPVAADRKPCRRYTIYCIEQSHMDIGYAYLQQEALRRHQQDVEEGLRLSAAAVGLPYDDRFRWNVESLYEVDDWLKKAAPPQIAQFRHAVLSGDLGLSAIYCNELTGLCRPEELVSLLACANEIRTKYGVPIDTAMITDVPGYTWGLVPVLAQSGVKYISWGPNGGDHLGFAREFDNQAFYWRSPSGKDRVMVWQGPNGYYPIFGNNDDSLIAFLGGFDASNPHYPYDMIYDRHTMGDNGPPDLDLPKFVHDWNSRYAYPHLVLSTMSRAFHDFDARYGRSLHEIRGDYTGYWEDGAASSAVETAINRRAAESIAQSEMLYDMLDPTAYPYANFADAWKNALLYDEHTWGADQSWSDPESDFTRRQWAFKRQFALNARNDARALQSGALAGLARVGDDVTVVNTSTWKRTDLVILTPELSRAGDVVRDERGKAVPSQRLADGSLAFLAVDIPATSSRKFHVCPGHSTYRGTAYARGNRLGTASGSLTIDPLTGAISSWTSKSAPVDLVDRKDPVCRGLNDYLYVFGESNKDVQYASTPRLTIVDAGPLVASIRIDSDAPGSKSLQRIIQVVDGLDQVRIDDTLDKLAVHQDEAVHLGFALDVPSSTVRIDMPWSVVRPEVDQTPHANKNVYPVGRWVDISNGRFGVTCATLDTPILQIGRITLPRENDGAWLRKAVAGTTIYWNAMNNYWHTNYKAYQPGLAEFRYVLRAHGKYDQASTQRFGVDCSQPLIVAPVNPKRPDAALPLTVDNPSVMMTMCEPAEKGGGWLVRLFNGSEKAQSMTLLWKGKSRPALYRTDLWGGGARAVGDPLALVSMEIVTLRVMPGRLGAVIGLKGAILPGRR